MNSPPKPRREVALCLTTDLQKQIECNGVDNGETVDVASRDARDVTNLESCLVEKAVSDLPALASQVFTVYGSQNSELSRHQEDLAKQQELIKNGEEVLSELQGDMKCLRNRIFLAEECNNDTSKRMKSLDKDIQKLVTIIVEKELNLKHTQSSADYERRKLQDDIQKMQRHSDLVEENVKLTSTTYAKLLEIKQEVDCLKEQTKSILENHSVEKDGLFSGVDQKLTDEIDDMNSKLLNFQNEAKLYESKIEEQKMKNNEIRKKIQVLQKRNAAKMTRLKKQVSDLHTRNSERKQQLIKLKNDLYEGEKRLTEHL